MLVHRYRLPLAAIGAAIAAGGATLLLRPRTGTTHPAAASAGDYFTPQQLERAHDFRAPQRTVFLVSLVLDTAVLGLPLSMLSEQRARKAGLSTQNWRSWSGDVAKATAIGAGMTGVGSSLGLALIRRFPRSWWIPGSAAVVGFSALLAFASPVVI